MVGSAFPVLRRPRLASIASLQCATHELFTAVGRSLADAEPTKDAVEDVVGDYDAGHLTQGRQGGVDFGRDELLARLCGVES